MAKQLVKSFDRNEAAMFIVHLAMPKIKKYIRKRKSFNLFALIAKMSFIKDCIRDFMDLPENAVINKAFKSTPYATNISMLAKKFVNVV